jgi:hypothetical protein
VSAFFLGANYIMSSRLSRASTEEIASTHPEVEFALVLARTIDGLTKDPEQLRGAVYELAREKLLQLAQDDPREKARLMRALEVAIVGVEAHANKYPVDRLALSSRSSTAVPAQVNAIPASGAFRGLEYSAPVIASEATELNAHLSRGAPRLLRLSSTPMRLIAVLLFFGVACSIIVAQKRGLDLNALKNVAGIGSLSALNPAAVEPAPTPVQTGADLAVPEPAKPSLKPKAYGVYSESGDKLYELQALPGKAPDTRIAISAAITRPVGTVVPDGKLKFFVFLRNPPSGALDNIDVRIVARIKRATSFNGAGKPVIADSENTWVIRNISIPFRAAPVKDDPQMFEIEPRDPDLALAPGRYALVMAGIAYDFAVDGPITDKRQCLEQLNATNGTFYAECAGR